jgi:hypothetical protein
VETLHLHAIIGEDRKITVRLPPYMPLGPVEVVVVVNPLPKPSKSIEDYYGIGKEMWEGIDVEKYINELRGPWPDEPAK